MATRRSTFPSTRISFDTSSSDSTCRLSTSVPRPVVIGRMSARISGLSTHETGSCELVEPVRNKSLELQHLPWDSDFFGFSIARVQGRPDAGALPELARQAGVRCAYCLCSVADTDTVRAAERSGFLLAEIRVILEARLADVATEEHRPSITKSRSTGSAPMISPISGRLPPSSRHTVGLRSILGLVRPRRVVCMTAGSRCRSKGGRTSSS